MSASGLTMASSSSPWRASPLGPRARPRPRRSAGCPRPCSRRVVGGRGWPRRAGTASLATRLFVAGPGAAAAVLALGPPGTARAAEAALPLVAVAARAPGRSSCRRRATPGSGAALGLAARSLASCARRASCGCWRPRAAPLLLVRPAAVIRSRLTLARREQPRPLLHVAGGPRHGPRQAGLRPGPGHDPAPSTRATAGRRRPNPRQPHLHNNLLQIAAERGLPGLVFFLWWVGGRVRGRAARGAARAAAGRGPGWAAAGALAALAAVIVAGLFEYNFGDSEVLMFFLLLTAVPFALRHDRAARGLTPRGPPLRARARRPPAGDARRRVLVLGDVMLDEFLWGRVARISPEAPVPVVAGDGPELPPRRRRQRGRQRALAGRRGRARRRGGRGRGGRARARGARGARASSRASSPSGDERPTTVKTRIVAHGQQVVRADREDTADLPRALEAALVESVRRELAGACGARRLRLPEGRRHRRRC